jgi:hypothetical protein
LAPIMSEAMLAVIDSSTVVPTGGDACADVAHRWPGQHCPSVRSPASISTARSGRST